MKNFLNKNNILIVQSSPQRKQTDWLAFRWGHVRNFEKNFHKPLKDFKHLSLDTTQIFVMCLAAKDWNVEKALLLLNQIGINDQNEIIAAQQEVGLCDKDGKLKNVVNGKATEIQLPAFVAVDFDENIKYKELLEDVIKKCPDFFKKVDLRCANIPNAILRYADLTKTDLEGANLKGSDLGGSNLEKAILWKAILEDTKFCNAKMVSTTIIYATLNAKTNFTGADLGGATYLPWNPSINRWGYLFAKGVDRETRQRTYGGDTFLGGVSNVLEAGNKLLQACGLNRQR
ncbi:MAG: pentapeptide repeat-containing protein [Holosporaceae bacterium]|jgi:hypothetical protein